MWYSVVLFVKYCAIAYYKRNPHKATAAFQQKTQQQTSQQQTLHGHTFSKYIKKDNKLT